MGSSSLSRSNINLALSLALRSEILPSDRSLTRRRASRDNHPHRSCCWWCLPLSESDLCCHCCYFECSFAKMLGEEAALTRWTCMQCLHLHFDVQLDFCWHQHWATRGIFKSMYFADSLVGTSMEYQPSQPLAPVESWKHSDSAVCQIRPF